MELTPVEQEKVLEMVADKLVAHLLAQYGDTLQDIVTIPLASAAQLLGIGPTQVSRSYPTVYHSPRNRGISLRALKHAVQERTKTPA